MIDDHGRVVPPVAGGEIETLLGSLDYQRATLKWKTSGLSADQLRQPVTASTMTLAGLLKHLALVEDSWFWNRFHGAAPSEPWAGRDWDADPDWEWRTAADDPPEELLLLWQDTVERSRAVVAAALERGDLNQLAANRRPDGTRPSLRWILLHLIEEYARHNGHADLLREAIDGQTGE